MIQKNLEQPFGLNQIQRFFSTTLFQYDLIKERIRESAFLIKGLRMNLIDLRKPQKESFKYDDGIKAYIELLNNDKKWDK